MTEFAPRNDGLILLVRAAPGARENALRGWHGAALKVSVTDAPEKGKANKAIVELLAKALCLKRSQITLLSGETSRDKQFLIRDIAADELRRRIDSACK